MTSEALAKRGPRMVLASVNGHFYIFREGENVLGRGIYDKWNSGTLKYKTQVWAKSFSLGYLLRCAKTMRSVV